MIWCFRRNESAQQLVLYNESDRSLQVQHDAISSSFPISEAEEMRICGECGRPWPFASNKSENIHCTGNESFMDRNYFRLLDISSRQQTPFLKFSSSSSSSSSSSDINRSTRSSRNNKSTNTTTNTNTAKTATVNLNARDELDSFEYENHHPKNLSDSSINQGYYRRFFVEDDKLGRGSGGSVFKCQHVLDGIELGVYAVKKVPVGDDHGWLNRMLREVHILENLRHPNIIEYKHAWLEYHKLTQFGPAIPCLFILMQLAEGGNLEEFVLNNRSGFESEFNVKLYCDWFEQICLGLSHLHRCGILHRDLKPSNILLKPGQDGKVQLLITDFGECASETSVVDHFNRTGATGTIEFVAPELLKGKKYLNELKLK